MKLNFKSITTSLVALGLVCLSGCQSVHKGLESEIVGESKPKREVSTMKEDSIAVPDLDERSEDKQYLSKIARLTQQVFELSSKLEEAETERDQAVKVRNAAQQNESALAELIEEFRSSLESAKHREARLKDKLLRTELQSVRYQQEIADLKIRELTKGEGK